MVPESGAPLRPLDSSQGRNAQADISQGVAQSVAQPITENFTVRSSKHMAGHRITLKDIARRLNLSMPTVSRALADHPDISAATKDRVREVAQALNYIPNYRARYLR